MYYLIVKHNMFLADSGEYSSTWYTDENKAKKFWYKPDAENIASGIEGFIAARVALS